VARVATYLQDAQLAVDFNLETATEGWQLFSVTFDPAKVSSNQVQQILVNAGARVIPAPAGP
jgi:hypothetical protein